MVIKEDIIEPYIENRLEFDLPEIIIENQDHKISGSGTVTFNSKGWLLFKMYTRKKNAIPFDYFVNQYNKSLSNAGKIIPKEDFFCFKGKKGSYTFYSCKQISINSCNENIIEGSLSNSFEILSPDKKVRKYKNAEVLINSNFNIPVNNVQSIEKTYADGHKYSNHSKNTFLININDGTIQMFNEKNHFIIHISSKNHVIDYKYIDNIINSLSFITSKYKKLNIIKFYNDNDEFKFTYNPNYTENRGSSLSSPPIDFTAYSSKPEHQVNLFIAYFNFISADKKGILLKIITRNLLASYSFLHVFSLTLTANIEELLKIYFKKYARNSSLKTKFIDDAIKKIKELDINITLQNRIEGFLKSSMHRTNIKDIFKGLMETKILSKEQISAWNKLRNSSAHGDSTSNFNTQSHIDLINVNLVLYYQIIFLLVGYKGLYSNYSEYGHPIENFDINL